MLVICGKSCTGKDTIVSALTDVFGFHRIVTYTTRPRRPGEEDGKDYHFVNLAKFQDMIDNGDFFETTAYDTVEGKWYYGTAWEDLEKADDNAVIIMNPHGVETIKGSDIPSFVVELTASVGTRFDRSKTRHDNFYERLRRISADNKDFKNIGRYTDLRLINQGKGCLWDRAREIARAYRSWVKCHE